VRNLCLKYFHLTQDFWRTCVVLAGKYLQCNPSITTCGYLTYSNEHIPPQSTQHTTYEQKAKTCKNLQCILISLFFNEHTCVSKGPTLLFYVKHETNCKRTKLTQNYIFKFCKKKTRKNSRRQGVTFGMWRPDVWKKVTDIMEESTASTSPNSCQTLQHIPHYSAVYSYRHKNLTSLVKELSRFWFRNRVPPSVTLPLTFLL
jgi:hypothetical protein